MRNRPPRAPKCHRHEDKAPADHPPMVPERFPSTASFKMRTPHEVAVASTDHGAKAALGPLAKKPVGPSPEALPRHFFFFCKRRAQSRSRLLRPFRNAAGVYGLAYLQLEPKMLCFWQQQILGGTKECCPSIPRSVRHVLVECLLLLEWRKIHDLSRSGEGDYLSGGN